MGQSGPVASEPGRGWRARWRGTALDTCGSRGAQQQRRRRVDHGGATAFRRRQCAKQRETTRTDRRLTGYSIFARGWARRRAGGGLLTTDQSDGRNSSGGRQWQDRFWRIRPGSSSTRGLGSWKRWRGRCSREESRRGCRRWSESTSEGSSVRSEPEEIKEKAACADKAHMLFTRHQNLPSTGMARCVSGRSESTTTA